MYEWVVFLHVAAVLGFMLAHGVHVSAMLAMRSEADPAKSLTIINAVPNIRSLRIMLGLLLVSGVVAGFAGSWWSRGWIWLSLVLLALIAAAMWRYGGPYYGQVLETARRHVEAGDPLAQQVARHDFDAARGSWHPIGMMVIGLGGTAVILWLMMFKPF